MANSSSVLESNELPDSILANIPSVIAVGIFSYPTADFVCAKIRDGFNSRFASQSASPREMWGAWLSILLSVAGKMDEYTSAVQYVAVGRKDYKTVILRSAAPEPFLVSVAADPSANAHTIAERVQEIIRTWLVKEG